jgi:GT2 family glycosyltransferase
MTTPLPSRSDHAIEMPPPRLEAAPDSVGVVVIGRNEGQRLKRCIESLQRREAGPIVYVDSGSTDGSVEYAQARGVTTVALDLSRPFNMGRARNAGFTRLLAMAPGLRYVQFVDGDCEMDDGWVPHARLWLDEHPEYAIVCGHLREREPHASAYNRLFDMESRGATGAIDACGGIAMHRVADFAGAGGFAEHMIAGEEAELCVRLRRAGRGVFRSAQPMALHDADMHLFKQWWMRAIRSGHAYADVFAIHGLGAGRHNRQALAGALVYGLALPAVCAACAIAAALVHRAGWLALGVLALQAVAWAKITASAYNSRLALGDSRADSALYAAACAIGKTPEGIGVLKFARNRLTGRQSALIEYRRAQKPASALSRGGSPTPGVHG